MTTREEIEAALERRRDNYRTFREELLGRTTRFQRDSAVDMWRVRDADTLADAFLAERAERQRRIEAAATEIWRKIPKEFAHFERGQVGQLIAIITRHLIEETT